MPEEEPNWFSRWEEELPTPDELMPLSQTLITPDLALAFDIPSPNSTSSYGHHTPPIPPAQSQSPSHHHHQGGDYDSSDMGGGGSGGVGGAPGDDQARTLKRPRLVWTPQLHKRFVDAVAHLGIKNAVPKTIMQLMSVDGLTRENVASHLQKYRLYLKRMQGLSSGGGGGAGGPVSPADAATEHLFASAPVPHHFLNRGPPPVLPGGGAGGGPEQIMPYVPVAALQQHHHQQQMAALHHHHHQQQQYYHHRQMGHIRSPPGAGFDHGFLSRQQQHGMHRMVNPAGVRIAPPPPSSGLYVEDLNSGAGTGGSVKKELTLFPTNDD